MTKKDFDNEFNANELKQIAITEGSSPDKPARRMAYNDKMDAYHKNGRITNWQVNNWIIPERFETTRIYNK